MASRSELHPLHVASLEDADQHPLRHAVTTALLELLRRHVPGQAGADLAALVEHSTLNVPHVPLDLAPLYSQLIHHVDIDTADGLMLFVKEQGPVFNIDIIVPGVVDTVSSSERTRLLLPFRRSDFLGRAYNDEPTKKRARPTTAPAPAAKPRRAFGAHVALLGIALAAVLASPMLESHALPEPQALPSSTEIDALCKSAVKDGPLLTCHVRRELLDGERQDALEARTAHVRNQLDALGCRELVLLDGRGTPVNVKRVRT